MTQIELGEGVARVPREEWDALVGDESPFLEWDWLASLEESGAVEAAQGWAPRPLLLREAGRLVAACPLYVKAHSEGEFVFDFAWAEAAARAGIPYYPKLLVAVPFTPVGGARFLTAPGAPRAKLLARLARALRELCAEHGLSSVHVNFCRADELAALETAGFVPRLGLQYHWTNAGYEGFDDFLARFRSKRRNQIQRERRALAEAGVRIEVLEGDEIPDAHFAPLFRLYRSTVDQHPWGRRYLNAEFFELLRLRYRRRLALVLAYQAGELVAGTLNVRKGEALYGRYWGAFRSLRHLHFNVCYYAAIEHCIRTGLRRFEPGAGGEFKQVRGFDATPTWSAHFVEEPRLAAAVTRHLARERAVLQREIDALRERSALKPDAA